MMGLTIPEYPALHLQALGVSPFVLPGQISAVQVLVKNGAIEVAKTVPKKPGLQMQVSGLAPLLLIGHVTAKQELK